MATAAEFYKTQMGKMKDTELWLLVHESPSGIMTTPVSKEKMKAALNILDERNEEYRYKVVSLEERVNKLEGKPVQKAFQVVGRAKRGRPAMVKKA